MRRRDRARGARGGASAEIVAALASVGIIAVCALPVAAYVFVRLGGANWGDRWWLGPVGISLFAGFWGLGASYTAAHRRRTGVTRVREEMRRRGLPNAPLHDGAVYPRAPRSRDR